MRTAGWLKVVIWEIPVRRANPFTILSRVQKWAVGSFIDEDSLKVTMADWRGLGRRP
jgi:hypothetical protein